jgi:hypothetical protein
MDVSGLFGLLNDHILDQCKVWTNRIAADGPDSMKIARTYELAADVAKALTLAEDAWNKACKLNSSAPTSSTETSSLATESTETLQYSGKPLSVVATPFYPPTPEMSVDSTVPSGTLDTPQASEQSLHSSFRSTSGSSNAASLKRHNKKRQLHALKAQLHVEVDEAEVLRLRKVEHCRILDAVKALKRNEKKSHLQKGMEMRRLLQIKRKNNHSVNLVAELQENGLESALALMENSVEAFAIADPYINSPEMIKHLSTERELGPEEPVPYAYLSFQFALLGLPGGNLTTTTQIQDLTFDYLWENKYKPYTFAFGNVIGVHAPMRDYSAETSC